VNLGDGWCDAHAPYNTLECKWDGGDCCDTSKALYDCRDPSSPNFGKHSPKGHIQPSLLPRNPRYTVDVTRQVTLEEVSTTYNNYYEFGMSKDISANALRHAAFLNDSSWSIEIGGLVDNPMTLTALQLVNSVALEERLYRHRCVEAWSIVVPWYGFPVAKLLEIVKPQPGAKFIKFTSWKDEKVSPIQAGGGWPWPYTEGISMAEAYNDLAFFTVGMYQRRLPPQNGAPIRVTLPWKYGFKSGKSISKIEFLAEMPTTFWNEVAPSEYGFWANVNPSVPHRRWSQASEREMVTSAYGGKQIPTVIYNGYERFVEHLYGGPEFAQERQNGMLFT